MGYLNSLVSRSAMNMPTVQAALPLLKALLGGQTVQSDAVPNLPAYSYIACIVQQQNQVLREFKERVLAGTDSGPDLIILADHTHSMTK